jgi:hypothetical protein
MPLGRIFDRAGDVDGSSFGSSQWSPPSHSNPLYKVKPNEAWVVATVAAASSRGSVMMMMMGHGWLRLSNLLRLLRRIHAPTAKICQTKHPRLNYWSGNNFMASWSIMLGAREDALLGNKKRKLGQKCRQKVKRTRSVHREYGRRRRHLACLQLFSLNKCLLAASARLRHV